MSALALFYLLSSLGSDCFHRVGYFRSISFSTHSLESSVLSVVFKTIIYDSYAPSGL